MSGAEAQGVRQHLVPGHKESRRITCAPLSAHELPFVAVHAADILDIFVAHFPEHGSGLARARAALAVDVDRGLDVTDVVDDKVNAVQGHINASLDMAGLVFGACSDVDQISARCVSEFFDGGVDIGFIEQYV